MVYLSSWREEANRYQVNLKKSLKPNLVAPWKAGESPSLRSLF